MTKQVSKHIQENSKNPSVYAGGFFAVQFHAKKVLH